jgi:hypothetical protein
MEAPEREARRWIGPTIGVRLYAIEHAANDRQQLLLTWY